MRPLVLVGIILAVLGAFVLIRGGSYKAPHDVAKIGDVHVTANERHAVPTWVGGVAVIAGLVLIGAGARPRGGGSV